MIVYLLKHNCLHHYSMQPAPPVDILIDNIKPPMDEHFQVSQRWFLEDTVFSVGKREYILKKEVRESTKTTDS